MPHAAVRPSFGRVALIGKLRSAEIAESLRELRGMLEQRGCEVLIERETASDLGVRGVDYAAIGAEAKLAIVVGGDGTMLALARQLAPFDVPLIGINQGRLGFLTDIPLAQMTPLLVRIPSLGHSREYLGEGWIGRSHESDERGCQLLAVR